MTIQSKTLTVGQLRKFLETVDRENEITFGSTKYSQRPLIFYRFKQRGEKLLQIELNELEDESDQTSEIDHRKTVGDFLDYFNGPGPNIDDWQIEFGSSLDGVVLEFRSIKNAVAINLEQNSDIS